MGFSHSFFRFLLVGGVATLIHYSMFAILYRWLHFASEVATSIGFVASAIFNFSANYLFTFRSITPIATAVFRYIAVASIGLILNAVVFSALLHAATWPIALAQISATGVVLVWNYLGGRHFTFASSAASGS